MVNERLSERHYGDTVEIQTDSVSRRLFRFRELKEHIIILQ
jgi:hypothetical protein